MFLTIIVFIFILGLLILVHELGHFITAKKFGVKCFEFGMGLPPRLVGIIKKTGLLAAVETVKEGAENLELDLGLKPKRGFLHFLRNYKIIKGKGEGAEKEQNYKNTIYSLNWLPIGGFVNIKGQDGDRNNEPDSFGAQKIWKRIIILASGVTMNFVLAMVLFSIVFMSGSPQEIDATLTSKNVKISNERVIILSVAEKSAAENAGLRMQDKILNIDGKKFLEIADIQKYVAANSDKKLTVEIKRGDQIIKKEILPENLKLEDGTTKKVLGISMLKVGTVKYPFFPAIWEGITYTLALIKIIVIALFTILKDLIVSHKLTTEVTGPVGIAVLTGQVVNLGFIYVLNFIALLSVNLGVVNFFPFPALDGGRVIGLFVEAIRRQPNNQRIESIIHNIGFGLLMALVVLVTFHDILKFGGKFLDKLFS